MVKRKTYRKRSRNRRRTRRRKKQRRRKTRKRRRRRRRRGGANRPPLPPPPLDIFSPTPYEGIKRTIIHNRKEHLASLVANLGMEHKITKKYRSATNINDQVIEHARKMWKQRITHPPGLTKEQFRQVEGDAMRAEQDAADKENNRRNARNRAIKQQDTLARTKLACGQQVGPCRKSVPVRVPRRRSGANLEPNLRKEAMERAARRAKERARAAQAVSF